MVDLAKQNSEISMDCLEKQNRKIVMDYLRKAQCSEIGVTGSEIGVTGSEIGDTDSEIGVTDSEVGIMDSEIGVMDRSHIADSMKMQNINCLHKLDTRCGNCSELGVMDCSQTANCSQELEETKLNLEAIVGEEDDMLSSKRPKTEVIVETLDMLDVFAEDILILILGKLISTASSPSDFINILFTCKRFSRLGLHPLVLSKASPKALGVAAKNWSDKAHQFMKMCIDAGNNEACYILGMIRFYCLELRRSGASLMARAAINSHTSALYSLAIIQFNGSGNPKEEKNLRAGVALCSRAASLGHIDALRELGHCLQDGYGVQKNIKEGRKYLLQANARELAQALYPSKDPLATMLLQHKNNYSRLDSRLWSDFGCNIPTLEVHPANRFMIDWFELKGGPSNPEFRMCSHQSCGRVETHKNEYRRCSGCGKVNYCSRACQGHDWVLRHAIECGHVAQNNLEPVHNEENQN